MAFICCSSGSSSVWRSAAAPLYDSVLPYLTLAPPGVRGVRGHAHAAVALHGRAHAVQRVRPAPQARRGRGAPARRPQAAQVTRPRLRGCPGQRHACLGTPAPALTARTMQRRCWPVSGAEARMCGPGNMGAAAGCATGLSAGRGPMLTGASAQVALLGALAAARPRPRDLGRGPAARRV